MCHKLKIEKLSFSYEIWCLLQTLPFHLLFLDRKIWQYSMFNVYYSVNTSSRWKFLGLSNINPVWVDSSIWWMSWLITLYSNECLVTPTFNISYSKMYYQAFSKNQKFLFLIKLALQSTRLNLVRNCVLQ